MKLPLKHIVILVICSLAGIFAYQGYWLTGLYQTMKQEMENTIREAMRTSDFNEVVLRVKEPDSIYTQENTVNTEPKAVATSDEGLDVLLKKQDSLKELLLSVQQGIHAGVDTYIDVNLQRYDSLLTAVLKEHAIQIPHHTLLIYTGKQPDSSIIYTDTLGIAGDSMYIPTSQALRYDYTFNNHSTQHYN